MTAKEFNDKYGVGTSVNYHSVIGQSESKPVKTRSAAWTLENGQHVVQVSGQSGCVSLAAISVDADVEEYARLGLIANEHHIDCVCVDCVAFMTLGDKVHAKGMSA